MSRQSDAAHKAWETMRLNKEKKETAIALIKASGKKAVSVFEDDTQTVIVLKK